MPILLILAGAALGLGGLAVSRAARQVNATQAPALIPAPMATAAPTMYQAPPLPSGNLATVPGTAIPLSTGGGAPAAGITGYVGGAVPGTPVGISGVTVPQLAPTDMQAPIGLESSAQWTGSDGQTYVVLPDGRSILQSQYLQLPLDYMIPQLPIHRDATGAYTDAPPQSTGVVVTNPGYVGQPGQGVIATPTGAHATAPGW